MNTTFVNMIGIACDEVGFMLILLHVYASIPDLKDKENDPMTGHKS